VVHATTLDFPARRRRRRDRSTTSSSTGRTGPQRDRRALRVRPARSRAAGGARRPRASGAADPPDYIGKNLPTSLAERVNVRLTELDGTDEVTIDPAAAEVPA